MVEEWVLLGQYLETAWLRALKAKPRSEADSDGPQACLMSLVGAVSVPSLSSPWHREHGMDEWALSLQGHQC